METKNIQLGIGNFSTFRPLKVGLYSFGKCHTIDKYFQVMLMIDLMIDDPRYEPCILTDGTSLADEDLHKKYDGVLEFIDLRENDLNHLGLSAMIVIDPYSIPVIPYREIKVPIIYKEYGVAGVEAGTGYLVNRSSYRYADLIVTESPFTRDEILRKYPTKKVIVGSPAFDYMFQTYEEDPRFEKGKKHVLWTPHHSVMSKESFDLIEGGTYSTFVTFKDYLTGQFLEENPDVVLHIKYHPILGKRYNAYCKANGIDDTFNRFLKSVKIHPRIFIHDKEDYHGLFYHSDIILNDSVSFTLEWVATRKPMIVLEDDNKSAYSPFGESLINDCYFRAKGVKELSKFFSDKFFYDFKIFNRTFWLKKMMLDTGLFKSNSSILLNRIYDRYKKEGESND